MGRGAFSASGQRPMAQRPPIKPVPVMLHVANAQGSASDANPGTDRLPLKTIGRAAKIALTNNARGVATTVVIHPGMSRESVEMRAETPAPITFQAAENGTVVLSGSDAWADWHPSRPGVYRHAWPFRWGATPIPAQWPTIQELARRREMIFVDGRL